MISKSLIEEFQQAIKEDYGEDVAIEEVAKILTDLVGFFDKLAEIYHKDLTGRNVIMETNKK
jgi:hypothetical protein